MENSETKTPGQYMLERDRLFQSLKESARRVETLLHSSSNDKAVEGDSDPTLNWLLRVEKAQLLSASSEEVRKRAALVRGKAAAVTSPLISVLELACCGNPLENVKLK
jgi:hypothetical protein